MNVQPDKDQWWEKVACKGTGPWVWADVPSDDTVSNRLSICQRCPVAPACAQDCVNTEGPRPYPYQIRGGLRMWTDDVDQLPDVVQLSYVPPKKGPGRPRSALSILNVKPQSTREDFNPHTRGTWNTP